jgi:succinate-semialdehyde dehydrogenase/glutarate-semialdehyde dehydrogenase
VIHSINPTTEETLTSFEPHNAQAVNERLDTAWQAQKKFRRTPIQDRLTLLTDLARVLRKNKQAYARLITLEMGKAFGESLGEIEKCAVTCEYYAAHAGKFLADEIVASNASDSRVVFDPLGILLAVMPWNYPFWQAMRAAIPAVAAGNTVVLKHASNVPQCALALESLFTEAGAPAGIFTTLLVSASSVQSLIEDSRIAAVTFTGSTPVGRTIASQAGNALKKQVLELGGSDPFIVLADADIKLAAAAAARARFQNAGQSCISSKRFIVENTVADAFVAAFRSETERFVMGDPFAEGTTVGPMARESLRDDLHKQVAASIGEGARVVLGGKVNNDKGYFYAPTILDHVSPGMTVAREETFGPAAAVIRVASVEEAIDVANSTEFGLGAALWSQDLARAAVLAHQIDAGAVFVNGMVASDARLPFGGVKQSGYGRELGVYGLREFTNIKTVWTGPAR